MGGMVFLIGVVFLGAIASVACLIPALLWATIATVGDRRRRRRLREHDWSAKRPADPGLSDF